MDDIVQLLLDKGASVNAEGGDYGTALQAASSGGHITIIHLLIKYGADINLQSGKYGSALSAALYKNKRAVVQLLRKRGAKLVTSDKNELPYDTSVLSASR
ncbi:ankyrin, partial [Stereum hirsutum FP-91666 SS1]|uniref:ankyrin n=1 Tax=Stereum hirsutum (strain FP-91666) TaxID=721885 RepID=UPI000444A351